ncbi:C13 family peptidase [Erythrobacter sanguineus]|uniref:Peptidase C13 family protein n=1 Tax=Erythrobacter sanguineus TaxID=198312 RepID=A0A1M7SIT3_9SPHN|nr:C13 family peptidase [Erythrobacter sanguineus]SHN58379.1 Peptidase C13 family protein [Erythrobacter sanguineus]
MNRGWIIAGMLAALLAAPALPRSPPANSAQPPPHTAPFPDLGSGEGRAERRKSYEMGPELQRGVSAVQMREQQRRLDAALVALQPHTPGTPDAFVVTVALDSDPVFAREAREAGRVLAARYGAGGRTLVLAGPDGARDDAPHGSISALVLALSHIGSLMEPSEDVLVLYTTSHGMDLGLAYHYGDTGYGILSPARLKSALEEAGIRRRVLILSACYSGVFVPLLAGPDTAILTAAASTRTSFGCAAENDWTFFGDALINRALRQPVSLEDASRLAGRSVAEWETTARVLASLPQTSIGAGAKGWLPQIEAGMPRIASAPVGRPAFDPAAFTPPVVAEKVRGGRK